MSEFEERLRKAVERGDRRLAAKAAQSQLAAMNESELRNLHTRYRLQLTEHIDQGIRRLIDHFPGFRPEVVFGDRGWGTAISRDDLEISRDGKRSSGYSRLELTVRPYSDSHVLDLAGKATVRNREVFHRNHFTPLAEVDPVEFSQLVDAWIVEYAEFYASHRSS
jgi:hypothetical protein